MRTHEEDKGEGVEVEDEGTIQQPQVKNVAKIGQGGVEDDDDGDDD
uniref:Uncharacterized protein n=1 Tax=Fagus sylvatica TaxID=28930 RepID=A0A2N9HKD2_FAGSY